MLYNPINKFSFGDSEDDFGVEVQGALLMKSKLHIKGQSMLEIHDKFI